MVFSLLYSHPVITSSPSEDHTYSAGNDNAEDTPDGGKVTNGGTTSVVGSSNGVNTSAFAFERETNQTDQEYEEQRKKAEGVDALLNLAGFASNTSSQIIMKRRASSSDMMGSYSNENSLDCSSSAVLFSSPSPSKRSKTHYLQPSVV